MSAIQSPSVPVIGTEESVSAPSRPIPSLRNNFAWTFAGNILYAGCQWGMLSALAKLGNASIVGQFTLGLAVAAPVFMFTNLQLRTVQATDVHAESGFADYFTLRILATLLGLATVALTLPFIKGPLALRAVVFLVACTKSVECMSDVIAGLLQREEQLKRVAISLMIRGIGSVLLFSLAFAYSRNLALAVAVMIAVWFSVLLFYDVPNAKAFISSRESFFRLDVSELKRLVLLSLPLGWIATLQSLNVNIPRYFLQHYLGLADQGVYASLAYLVVVINLVVYALSQSATTRLAHMFAENRRKEFAVLLTKLSMFGVLVAALGVPLSFVLGRPLLTLLYRREYGDHVGLLALLVGTAALNTIGSFLFCGVTAARAFRVQVPIYLFAMLTVILGSALLIPRWGLMGAGWSVLISAGTVALGGLWVIRRVLAGQKPW